LQVKRESMQGVTVENRRIINLDEIMAIQYRCKCGTTVTVPREKWGTPQRYCSSECSGVPNQPTNWIAQHSADDKALVEFQRAIKTLIDGAKGCRLGLEISFPEVSDSEVTGKKP
jgi:hypothetical protein